MQNLSVKLENTKGNELIIREGKALEQRPPEKIRIEGDIKSVSNFLSIRKKNTADSGHEHQLVDANRVIVTVDKAKMFIHLATDPGCVYGTEITGKLEVSDELEKWFINQPETFSLKELVKLFQFNRLDFDVSDQQAVLLKAYMTFNIKQYIDLEQQQPDNKGNQSASFNKRVDFNLPTKFTLNIPIFKGFPSASFDVEICLQSKENSVSFWFESIELHELMIAEKERIFNEELKSCEGFVIINQ